MPQFKNIRYKTNDYYVENENIAFICPPAAVGGSILSHFVLFN